MKKFILAIAQLTSPLFAWEYNAGEKSLTLTHIVSQVRGGWSLSGNDTISMQELALSVPWRFFGNFSIGTPGV